MNLFNPTPKIPQIRPAELAAWFEFAQESNPAPGQPVLLDVREPHELVTASVEGKTGNQGVGVIAIPMGSVPARVTELDPARPIAVLCHHGARSQRVAAFLADNGFAQVANIAGGIDAWSVELDASIARY